MLQPSLVPNWYGVVCNFTIAVFSRVGIICHSLNFFSLYDGEKECRVYTLFLHLITMGKKSGGTLSDFHCTKGEKECSPLFLPICNVGKKSGGYTVSFVCWDQSCLDMY